MRALKINYHGAGYVGLTGAVHYHSAGYRVVLTDPDLAVCDAINAGHPKAGSFLHYTTLPLVGENFVAQTTADPGADCHILAVPSEKGNEPYMDIVIKLFAQLNEQLHPQIPIIIESTLMPGMAKLLREGVAHTHRPWAIAPRRDWFADKDKNLMTLTRVVGVDAQHHVVIEPFITAVCNDVQWTTPETAEVTKALENALLHLPVVLLHELALLYPDYDICEAARLASSHWRFRSMGGLYLGLGTGGRCVPLGTRYLSERGGALLGDATEIDESFAELAIGNVLPKDFDQSKLALVLGLAYRPGFKDAGNSPGLRVIRALTNFTQRISIADPNFTADEISQLVGPYLRYEASGIVDSNPVLHDAIASADLIVLTVAHEEFIGEAWPTYAKLMKKEVIVIDATGAWEWPIVKDRPDIKYVRPGRPGWYALDNKE